METKRKKRKFQWMSGEMIEERIKSRNGRDIFGGDLERKEESEGF